MGGMGGMEALMGGAGGGGNGGAWQTKSSGVGYGGGAGGGMSAVAQGIKRAAAVEQKSDTGLTKVGSTII